MDYSLQTLNKIAKLNNLTFSSFIEKLNLIGLEVDDIFYEKVSTNSFLDNTRIFLKIPANREDLLNEKFFIEEISTIFLFQLYEIWEQVKTSYFFILKEKYREYQRYSIIPISSQKPNVITYVIHVQNAKLKTSPLWIINKLLNFGLKPYNNVTDVLNVAFYEWGQNTNILPLKSLLLEPEYSLEVEYLLKTEDYSNEQNKIITLYPGTIVLREKFSQKIQSVLGIIQSTLNTSLSTSSFFLEATFYDIHENPLLLNTLNTKISLKYLRRSFLQNFKYCFQRILTLLELITDCKISSTKYCTLQEKIEINTSKLLRLKKRNLINFLNIKLPDPVIFQKAGLKVVCETKTDYYFKIPVFRQDLSREIDIIEEYSRFIGYKNFQEILPKKELIYSKSLFRQKNYLKNYLLQAGFDEVITNPISDFDNIMDFSVLINNPLNNELSVLRRSLLPKLISVFELNSKLSNENSSFFEIGRTFKKVSQKVIEQDKIAGISIIKIGTNQELDNWFDGNEMLNEIFTLFGYTNIETKEVKKTISYFHPTRSVLFKHENKTLGIYGEIHPQIRKEKYSHVDGKIYLFELNLTYFKDWQISSSVKTFVEYSKYPLISQDISITLPINVNIKTLQKNILLQSVYLQNISIFDVYFPKTDKITDTFNLGITLEFQSKTETLTKDTIQNEIIKIKSFINTVIT
jgi:phenylalanyl-tRNA synthetase beta chain